MEFSVSTWNCFGMGQGIDALTHTRAPVADRFKDADLLTQCAAADVFCVQELFSRDAQAFFDGLHKTRFTAGFRDDNRIDFASVTVRGTGLGIGTRVALSRPYVRNFPGARVGWDRLARKGALYAQLELSGGLLVDVITAHLQAGYDRAAVEVRAAQLTDLTQLIATTGSRDRPFIVCGDFNIDGLSGMRREIEYLRLARALADFEDLGAADDWATFHPHPNGNGLAYAFEPDGRAQRIDYIFVRPAPCRRDLRCRAIARVFDRPLIATPPIEGRAAWPSDHYGLNATFAFDEHAR